MASVFAQEIERVGWHLAQTLVWVKNSFMPGRSDYHYQHEAVFYGWKPGAAHVWLGATDQSSVMDDEAEIATLAKAALLALVKELRNARRTDVICEDKTRHNDLHPTMKPTTLKARRLGPAKEDQLTEMSFSEDSSRTRQCSGTIRRPTLVRTCPHQSTPMDTQMDTQDHEGARAKSASPSRQRRRSREPRHSRQIWPD